MWLRELCRIAMAIGLKKAKNPWIKPNIVSGLRLYIAAAAAAAVGASVCLSATHQYKHTRSHTHTESEWMRQRASESERESRGQRLSLLRSLGNIPQTDNIWILAWFMRQSMKHCSMLIKSTQQQQQQQQQPCTVEANLITSTTSAHRYH